MYLFLLMAISYTTMAQNKEEAGVSAAVELLRKSMIDPDKAMLQ